MLKTMKAVGIRGESCRQNFQSNRAIEAGVTGRYTSPMPPAPNCD